MKVCVLPWVLLKHPAGAYNPCFLSHLSGKERADPPTATTNGARRVKISEASPSKSQHEHSILSFSSQQAIYRLSVVKFNKEFPLIAPLTWVLIADCPQTEKNGRSFCAPPPPPPGGGVVFLTSNS